MADGAQMRRLIAYNQWADERILTALHGIADEELSRPREAYFSTLRANLRHTLMAQRVWLARWKGETPPRPDDPIEGPWPAAYAATHAALAAYLSPMSDADFDRVVHYRNVKGEPYALPLGQLVTHLVNHGTAHRAETGLLLERLGRSPGDLDYLYFALSMAQRGW
jgi:uncharacterized damage-inducible protein DinB